MIQHTNLVYLLTLITEKAPELGHNQTHDLFLLFSRWLRSELAACEVLLAKPVILIRLR